MVPPAQSKPTVRQPSYRTIGLVRASLHNKMGMMNAAAKPSDYALEGLKLLSRDAPSATVWRHLSKTQRAHVLHAKGPAGWSANDVPGGLVPSARSICQAASIRQTEDIAEEVRVAL